MDRIFIRELPVRCIVGVLAHERSTRQQLLVSVELALDFTSAVRDDDLTRTVDYSAVAVEIERIAIEGRFQLLETLATHIADSLMVPPVTAVSVEIQKPAALPTTRKVGVSIHRPRTDGLP